MLVILLTTQHPISDENIDKALRLLKENTELPLCWFVNNYMKLNTDKCDLIVSAYKHEQVWAQVGGDKIWESVDAKLLGVTIDKESKFDRHVSKNCSKASRTLTVFGRMSKFLTFEKRKSVFKAFVGSQFKHCPLIWMFHRRYMNNKINRLYT